MPRVRTRLLAVSLLLVVSAVAVPLVGAQNGTNEVADAGTSVTIANVTVSPETPVTGEEFVVTATIQNGASNSGSFDISELSLRGGSGSVTADDLGTLGAGDSITVPLGTQLGDPGQQRLTLTLRGQRPDGTIAVIDRPVYVDVDPATVRPDLTATAAVQNDSSVIEVSLSEHGNVDLDNVQTQALVDGEPVATRNLSDVAAGETLTTTIDGSEIPAGEVTVVAEFTADGIERSVSDTLQYSPQETASVTLTGVEVTPMGATVSLSGEAANTGSADVGSVVVSVDEASGVEGVAPNGEYYVGEIEVNEFNTFELTAEASGDVDTVPVRVNYSANGEQYSTVVGVDVPSMTRAGTGNASDGAATDGASGPGQTGGSPGQSGGGGLPLLELGLGAVVIGGAFLIYRWRKQ